MAARKSTRPEPPEVCPVCGEDVPRNALACPECGADHEGGWKEGAELYDGLDLPDEDFNYEEFVEKEFGAGPKPHGIKPLWWITALVLLIATVLGYFASFR